MVDTKTNGGYSVRTARQKGTADEVARRAEVSKMTVSRVFNGSKRVSVDTREKVLKIADEIGYQPNSAARALRTGKLETIGFLLWSHDALRGQFHSESLAGFESIAGQNGLYVNLAIPTGKVSLPHLADDLIRSGRCGAIVIQSDQLAEQELRELEQMNAPLVLMNYSPDRIDKPNLSLVGYDNQSGIEQAVRHLAALGHRKIAYIGGTPEHHDQNSRESGFRRGLKGLGLELNEDWIRPGNFQEAFTVGGLQAEYLLAQGSESPTAVVCASDETALGAMLSARRCGLKVPDDLSIVGFDNISYNEYLEHPLTTVNHSGWKMGVAVGETLLKLIESEQSEPIHRVLDTRLIVRQTTSRPRVSS
jgi:DNA-binding LacI/PurR family transcriptional regulator